jgi:hypothetical protein
MQFTQPGGASITLGPGSQVTPTTGVPNELFAGPLAPGTSTPVNLAKVTGYYSLYLAQLPPGSFTELALTWYADAAGAAPIATDYITFLGAGFTQLIIKGAYLTVAAASTAGDDIQIIASYQQIAHERYQSLETPTFGSDKGATDGSLYLLTGTPIAATTTEVDFLPSRNGRATLTINTGAAITVAIDTYGSDVDVARLDLAAVATAASYNLEFTAPKQALQIFITNNGATPASPTVAVVFTD